MKIAIATDTNSGITAMEGEKLGVFVLAMPVNLEETIHYEGIDITSEQLYDAMRQHRDVSTSQPSPGQLMELWDGILAKGYDEIVYIPMSSGLSGSCQSAALFAQDYDGRVQVVDNHRISVTQKESVISALRLVEQGYDAGQIRDFLEKHAYDASIYITVDSMEYLKKGGRISKTVAFAGGMLNIKPVVTIQDGAVVMIGKARGSRNGNNLLVEKINQAGGVDFDRPVLLGYTGLSSALMEKYVEDSKALWEGHVDQLDSCLLCSVIGTHAGPGAVAVAFFKKG